MRSLLPKVEQEEVAYLLRQCRYVVLEGPPGTGKTRMAQRLLEQQYARNGCTVQFHASTTYENFIGGLAPENTSDLLGLRFAPKKGFLLEAAIQAERTGRPYLLHIDEINRADLSKVLGEAIYLLEVDAESTREINLPYDFGAPINSQLLLPPNLHLLGTMNTADRSLGFIDIAVRRRFAFTKLWPQIEIVEREACPLMVEAFSTLLSIFIEHASEDAFNLIPGHSYFLEKDDPMARQRLKVTLIPLLEDYLFHGYVTSFSEPLRSYLQWVESL
jgi:5-methylcytosine-specific restriction protein B